MIWYDLAGSWRTAIHNFVDILQDDFFTVFVKIVQNNSTRLNSTVDARANFFSVLIMNYGIGYNMTKL